MTEDLIKRNFDTYITDLPLLHSWDGGKTWNTGGLHELHLRAMAEILKELPEGFKVIETGAGNSTLCFLVCGAGSVVSIAPDNALFERIREFARQKAINSDALRAIVDYSEAVLPRIALKARDEGVLYDFALIDGGHGWPTVFVDFCYMMALLKQGGHLMIDDVQLHSVKELARFLLESQEFSLVSNLQKSLIFRKTGRAVRMPEGNPYIAKMTKREALAGKQWTFEH